MPNTEEWGKGYDFGQIGMMKAIKTAEELATYRERDRIIKLLDATRKQYTNLLDARPNRVDDHINHTICRTLDRAIALINGENK